MVLRILTCLALCLTIQTSYAKSLLDYATPPDHVIDKEFKIDAKIGYLTKKLSSNIYLLTDGIYQSLIIESSEGLVLVDAPESFSRFINKAIAEISDKNIHTIIYSHTHIDHIGASRFLHKTERAPRILASKQVKEFLIKQNDPQRIPPTDEISPKNNVIQIGDTQIKAYTQYNYHSDEGDLVLFFEKEKIVVAVDSISAGYVPFMNIGITSNLSNYIEFLDSLLEFDFHWLISGHVGQIATRQDVLITQQYIHDLRDTVTRIHKQTNMKKVMQNAAKQIGWSNKYLLFKVFLDEVIDQCVTQIEPRWVKKLAGVDVWSRSHCQTMLVHVRWDY